jgi:hypothetical protein
MTDVVQPEVNKPLPSAAEVAAGVLAELRTATAVPDTTKDEAAAFALEAERSRLKEELDARRQDRGERKAVGHRLIGTVQAWLIGVFLLLLWQGFGSKIGFFSLPETTLNTLLVTTTVNLIGLLYVIARYLYNQKWIPDSSPQKLHSPKPPA